MDEVELMRLALAFHDITQAASNVTDLPTRNDLLGRIDSLGRDLHRSLGAPRVQFGEPLDTI
jgi:hypothetical protein